MALVGTLDILREQAPKHRLFNIAFAYLEDLLSTESEAHQRVLALAPGGGQRIELGDGVFALEQAYLSKPSEACRWESHSAYIDLQVLVLGEERLGIRDIGNLVLEEDLRPAKDLLFYKACENTAFLRLGAGEAAVFFPKDGHRPGLQVGAEPSLVHKSVLKIPVFELQ